ncbi:hypothetical protein K8R78_02950 [bacterium]|nr:hypothetical protein [bacterium]
MRKAKPEKKEKSQLLRQWPGYLIKAAVGALGAILLQLAVDYAYASPDLSFYSQLANFFSFFSFYFLAQLLFPLVVVRLKAIPTALGLSLAMGGLLGYFVLSFFAVPGSEFSLGLEQMINIFVLGVLLGLLTGVGWMISKGKALGFYLGFLVSITIVALCYHFATPESLRLNLSVVRQGLTALASYLPVVALIWWRHRPSDGEESKTA